MSISPTIRILSYLLVRLLRLGSYFTILNLDVYSPDRIKRLMAFISGGRPHQPTHIVIEFIKASKHAIPPQGTWTLNQPQFQITDRFFKTNDGESRGLHWIAWIPDASGKR